MYRVAWRNIRDWVFVQLALHETEIVHMPQVFPLFATDPKGHTLYDKMIEGKFLLGDRKQEDLRHWGYNLAPMRKYTTSHTEL